MPSPPPMDDPNNIIHQIPFTNTASQRVVLHGLNHHYSCPPALVRSAPSQRTGVGQRGGDISRVNTA